MKIHGFDLREGDTKSKGWFLGKNSMSEKLEIVSSPGCLMETRNFMTVPPELWRLNLCVTIKNAGNSNPQKTFTHSRQTSNVECCFSVSLGLPWNKSKKWSKTKTHPYPLLKFCPKEVIVSKVAKRKANVKPTNIHSKVFWQVLWYCKYLFWTWRWLKCGFYLSWYSLVAQGGF